MTIDEVSLSSGSSSVSGQASSRQGTHSFIEIKEFDSTSSNSTDFGVSHGEKLLQEKVKVAVKKGVNIVESKISEVLGGMGIVTDLFNSGAMLP